MVEKDKNTDWIENYGFILVAFAHMTDWQLVNSEIHVINEKLQLMLSGTEKEFTQEDVAQKLVSILKRYESLRVICEDIRKTLDKNAAKIDTASIPLTQDGF